MASLPRKILFVHGGYRWSTFKRMDLDLLQSMYDTKEFFYPGSRRYLLPLLMGVLWADVAFIWFASEHSWHTVRLCKLLGKRSIIVTGGYDLANLPDIGYGLTAMGLNYRRPAELSLNSCDRVIAFSQSAAEEAHRNFAVSREKLSHVYLGVDSNRYRPDPSHEKSNLVVTVGSIMQTNLKRKGLETFVQAAQYLPDFWFVLIGQWADAEAVSYLKQIAPPNVEMVGYLSEEELVRKYQEAKVYAQVSHHEGFGLALAEAMSCECVPVVTAVGSIPEVVGECGYYVPLDNPEETALRILEAAQSSLGATVRQRVVERFPLESRRLGLARVIESLWAN